MRYATQVTFPHAANCARISAASQKRRQTVLSQIAQGATLAVAADAAGISPKTIEKWVRDDPEFRRARDEIRAAQRDADHARAREAGGVPKMDGTFAGFRKAMFGMDTYWHQAEIVRAIEEAPMMELSMINVPPEHGKTTLLTDYICKRIAEDPNIRITFVSEGQPHARKVVRHVKQRMTRVEQYPEFITRYGPFHIEGSEDSDKPWTNDFITVSRADHDERDYTLEARGINSAVAGTRADLLLIDDIQSLRSLNQTEKFMDILRQDFFTRVHKNGKIIVVGTRVGENDVYQALLDADLIAKHVELPAADANGEALCPEMWDAESLQKRRKQVGEDVWWRTYQQRPQASMARTFTPEAIAKAKDANLTIGGRTTGGDDVTVGKTRIACLDPALSGGNALHVAAFDQDNYFLLDLWVDNKVARVEKILSRIEEAAQLYRFAILVVEVNAFQQGFARDDRLRSLGEKYGFRIVEHETKGNKSDAKYGVAQMPTDFRIGSVHIPWADVESQAKFEVLVQQLERWRPDVATRLITQDAVMSLWFGWLQWAKTRRLGVQASSASSAWKRPGVSDLFALQRRTA